MNEDICYIERLKLVSPEMLDTEFGLPTGVSLGLHRDLPVQRTIGNESHVAWLPSTPNAVL